MIENKYQPMKIAAAEAQWTSCKPCSFSAFQIGGGSNDETPTEIIPIPHLLSVLATGTWNGPVTGLNELQAQYQKKYGPGNYVPERVHPVLVDAGHGVPREPGPAARAVGRVAAAQGPPAQLPAVPDCCRCGRWSLRS